MDQAVKQNILNRRLKNEGNGEKGAGRKIGDR
jgi:hypothetical protein